MRRELEALSGEFDVEEELETELQTYYEETSEYVEQTAGLLEGTEYGTFDTRLFSPLYDPSSRLESARQLRKEALPDEHDEALGHVVEAFQFFTTAREYFKTMCYKREFSRLSRDLLYTGLPSILLTSYVLRAALIAERTVTAGAFIVE